MREEYPSTNPSTNPSANPSQKPSYYEPEKRGGPARRQVPHKPQPKPQRQNPPKQNPSHHPPQQSKVEDIDSMTAATSMKGYDLNFGPEAFSEANPSPHAPSDQQSRVECEMCGRKFN